MKRNGKFNSNMEKETKLRDWEVKSQDEKLDASPPLSKNLMRRRDGGLGLLDSASDLSISQNLLLNAAAEIAITTTSLGQNSLLDNSSEMNAQKIGFFAYLIKFFHIRSRKTNSSESRFSIDSAVLVILLALAFVTRLIYIARSNRVIWDEAHFGKFASHYIKREFYFDVHPPLGKMMLGFAGWATGYNGSFDFESGKEYPVEIGFASMRKFCAFWGAIPVPLAYLSARALNFSRWSAITTASFVLFDNALTVISRFILLDSMLLFFTALGFYFWTMFVKVNSSSKPFSRAWWLWLLLLGLSLGAVSSVKWVGLFLVAGVGLYTIENLWDLFGSSEVTPSAYISHWLARILCLIVIPTLVYIGSFYLHFLILHKSGSGDAQMSSLFQANLVGSQLKNSPLEIAYGSKITLRSNAYGGGILHSHSHLYPHGSKQQQVTCYHHRDQNNEWIVSFKRNINGTIDFPELGNSTKINESTNLSNFRESDNLAKPIFLKNGDVIRLLHATTGRNLHSHPIAAPLTKRDFEVSCYGDESIGDIHDNWKVEIVSDAKRRIGLHSLDSRIHTLNTVIRLRHVVTGCLLRSNTIPLPEWGYKQHEVACDHSSANFGNPNALNNLWNVEQHWNPDLPIAEASNFHRDFIGDFINVNVGMWTTNNALVPDPSKEPDALTSLPFEWPFLTRCLRMCSWGDTDIKYLMIGNPLVWWISTGSIGAIVILYSWYRILMKRSLGTPWVLGKWNHFTFTGKWLILFWAMHFLPFAAMGRVLYLHHYFPALYFSTFVTGFFLDHLLRRIPSILRAIIYSVFVIAAFSVFLHFAPLTYGYDKPSTDLSENRMWRKTWNIS